MIKLWRFLSVSIVVAVCLGLMLVPAAQQAAADPGNEWGFEIQPDMTKVEFDTNFTLDANANCYEGVADTFGIYVTFNGSLLDVTDVTYPDELPNGYPPNVIKKPVWDNTSGWVRFAYTRAIETPDIDTSFTFATIHFRSKSVPGATDVNFTSLPDDIVNMTKILPLALNWSRVVNGTVVIGPAFNLTVTSNGCCPIDVGELGSLGTVAAYSNHTFIVPCPNVTLTAVGSACCVFNNWTWNGTFVSGNPIVVTGAANTSHTANATCSVPQYNLTMNVTGSGTTTPSGTSNHSCGEVVNVSATADPGWWFANWTGDLMGNTTPTTITMDGDKNVTANFVQRFTLTMNVTGNGTTDPAVGDYTYDNGTDVPINATPGSGWHFVNWTTADMSEIDDDTAALTVVTVDKNKTVTANFAINRYNLTINSTIGGNVTDPGEDVWGPYDHGTVVNLTATPDTDYAFVGWSGNVSEIADVNSSNTNITMYGNYSIMAHFAPHGISALPLSLTFTTIEGENPPSQTLEVCNTGNGTLNWSLTDGNTGWLTEAPTSGSLPEEGCEPVTVSVNVAGMKAGDYSATITVTGSLVLEVPVTLHIVSAMPEVLVEPASLSASSLSISPQQVQPGQEVTISVNVANTGGETGSYNAILYINSVVEDSQSVSVAAGTTKNVIFTVTKSQAGVYDVSLAGQSGQFEVVSTGWFAGGLGTGGIIAIVVVVIILIVAVVFIMRGTRREV